MQAGLPTLPDNKIAVESQTMTRQMMIEETELNRRETLPATTTRNSQHVNAGTPAGDAA